MVQPEMFQSLQHILARCPPRTSSMGPVWAPWASRRWPSRLAGWSRSGPSPPIVDPHALSH